MPVLPLEVFLFPNDLFDDWHRFKEDGRAWRVLHTKPRQEKTLAREVYRARLPFYLPLISRRSLHRNRLVEAFVPLFSGYVFLFSSREECFRSMATKRVARYLDVYDQEQLASDLSQVFRLIASGMPVTPEGRLVPGATVEIRYGALAGLKGKILRAASRHRFVIQVDFIHQGASVLLDDYYLEALSKVPADQAIGS
jgi:transcriptional antiterminator RfaH